MVRNIIFTWALRSRGRHVQKGGKTMKRALIVTSVGILASTVWVAAANAQANINQPGARGASQAGGAWYAAPRPNKRGNMWVSPLDSTRGYGCQKPCA